MNILELKKKMLTKTKDIRLKNNEYIEYNNIKDSLYKVEEDVLITPFFINNKNEVYELHYMELNIEFSSKKQSQIIKFLKEAEFSNEFKNKFNPKIVINKNDKIFLKEYLEIYFRNFENFNFKKEFNIDYEGDLYFQIY